MIKRLRNFWLLLVSAADDFIDDHAAKLSASLAYYTIFSIGPLLLVVITLLDFFYKRTNAASQVFAEVRGIIGAAATAELQEILIGMSKQANTTLIGVIGTLVFIFGATGIFAEIQGSINYIWSVKAKPRRSWLKYITDRLLSLFLVIGMAVLMLVTIFINLVVDILSGRLERIFGGATTSALKLGNTGLLFVVVTFVFAIIFKVLPDVRIRWKDAIVGAAFTGILFLIGKFLITYYLSVSKTLNAYGAATSVIIVLSWVYYSAMILYFGAGFTEAYAKKYGGGIVPAKNAVHIVKRETQGGEVAP